MTTTNSLQPSDASRGDRLTRHIITPEGVALPVRLADRGERLGAFLTDVVIMAVGVVVLVLAIAFALYGVLRPGWQITAIILVFFLVRSFYFSFFELRWRGMTPGKRLLRLRVIDNRGGPLRADSVIARNLMREVEVFLPLSLLVMLERGGESGWTALFTLLWVSILTLMPLFNRNCMRAGDMIAGTWVIATPKSELLPDIAASAGMRTPSVGASTAPAYAFSREQLDIYGIYELQVLEDVLRQDGATAATARGEVARRIRRKIDWQDESKRSDDRAFLEAFYTALRGRLESRMLLGKRRESKHDRS